MRTVGVDLAAEPKKTAVAVIDWHAGGAVVDWVKTGFTDADILAASAGAAKVGIDCPLGWPEPFIEFLNAQREGRPLAAHDLEGRRLLAYRMTDRAVTEAIGLRPLSVAADRIGHAAMRAAGLLAALEQTGASVDRSGAGLVVEVYPAAALKVWQLTHTKYKGTGSSAARNELVDALRARMPALELASFEPLCRVSDDAFDSLICALIARASALGKVTLPDQAQAAHAMTEGWIAIPTCQPHELTA
jgi:hypothetical protein